MNKKYIIGSIIALFCIALFSYSIYFSDKKSEEQTNSMIPRIGQRVWTYNMNTHVWQKYDKHDEDDSKEDIILQVQEPVGNGGYTSYHLLTGNAQVPKEDVWMGEGSEEFLVGNKLYSYFPKTFEFYEVIFNGVKFVPRKLSLDEIKQIFKGYEIIKMSTFKNNSINIDYSKRNNKFIVLNDIGGAIYKYYIIPNDNKKMEIDRFSNQFKVYDKVQIRLQRIEGCSKSYPCYEINIK